MAIYAVMQDRAQTPDGPRIPANAVVLAEQGLPVPRVEAAVQEPFEEPDAAPAPAAPKLPFRDVNVVKNDAPPPIDVAPEVPVAVPAERPGDLVAPAKKPARKEVDLNLFASCEAIGTTSCS